MFDDGLLDDAAALVRLDAQLRAQAEAGARVRREFSAATEPLRQAVEIATDFMPRAVVAAGPDSRLLRAVLETTCPVPFVAWPHASLPGWVGSLDLVVVLAPDGNDTAAARGVAEAVRRGAQLVVATPAGSLVAEHAPSRYTTILPTTTSDQLAIAVVLLKLLDELGLGPATDPEQVAQALDDVAVECSPFRDISHNPAKELASAIADSHPLIWGGTVLAARAARRFAEAIRRTTGSGAVAADAEHLQAILAAATPTDIFADPYANEAAAEALPPSLTIFAEHIDDALVHHQRTQLTQLATSRRVRVNSVAAPTGDPIACYAALLATGAYAALYLQLGYSSGRNPTP